MYPLVLGLSIRKPKIKSHPATMLRFRLLLSSRRFRSIAYSLTDGNRALPRVHLFTCAKANGQNHSEAVAHALNHAIGFVNCDIVLITYNRRRLGLDEPQRHSMHRCTCHFLRFVASSCIVVQHVFRLIKNSIELTQSESEKR